MIEFNDFDLISQPLIVFFDGAPELESVLLIPTVLGKTRQFIIRMNE